MNTTTQLNQAFVRDLEALLKREDVRTADRANIRTMLSKQQGGGALTTSERQTLWAYLDRYGRLEGKTDVPSSGPAAGK